MSELSERDVARLRTASLLLSVQAFERPAEVAHWFGAMQAQDLASGLWSFGVRLPHLDLAGVEAAVESGEVLRTWPMRGTLHFVEASDARWLLALTGVRALAGAAARRAYLGPRPGDGDEGRRRGGGAAGRRRPDDARRAGRGAGPGGHRDRGAARATTCSGTSRRSA